MKLPELTIVGGGLAGSEAAWQAAQSGLHVLLYEMRPGISTGAHLTADLAELVCSNSLGSNLPDRAAGVLKNELRTLHSLLLECAEQTALPAGAALAVDRDKFSAEVTRRISSHQNIEIIRAEITELPYGPTIIASGPLTSKKLTDSISRVTGEDQLYFFDAIAPIVSADSLNMDIVFRASRYDKGENEEGDYLNCPFTREQYEAFVESLITAERIVLKDFETVIESGVTAGADKFFEGCLPVEILGRRGIKSLAFGPMRPIGITDPHTGRWPYALIQLRQENLAASLYNLVGFQTNLTFPEQKRVFRTIPGLEKAEFVRYGQMHRNTFLAAPKTLLPSLQFRHRADLLFAGQITGVEGYMGNIATGLLAGINAARIAKGASPVILPETTMLGALCHYITHTELKSFQPMKANFGILPTLVMERKPGKQERGSLYAERSRIELDRFLLENGIV